MRILMLGNSYTSSNQLPDILSAILDAEVISHTRGGARLAEHLNPATRLGSLTQAALKKEKWDYVVLQEMSNGPLTSPGSFLRSSALLSDQILQNGAVPVFFATWAYQEGSPRLSDLHRSAAEMALEISRLCRQAALPEKGLVAEVGLRFLEFSADNQLYAADGSHPSLLGTQLAADTIATVIKNHAEKSVPDFVFPQ